MIIEFKNLRFDLCVKFQDRDAYPAFTNITFRSRKLKYVANHKPYEVSSELINTGIGCLIQNAIQDGDRAYLYLRCFDSAEVSYDIIDPTVEVAIITEIVNHLKRLDQRLDPELLTSRSDAINQIFK